MIGGGPSLSAKNSRGFKRGHLTSSQIEKKAEPCDCTVSAFFSICSSHLTPFEASAPSTRAGGEGFGCASPRGDVEGLGEGFGCASPGEMWKVLGWVGAFAG